MKIRALLAEIREMSSAAPNTVGAMIEAAAAGVQDFANRQSDELSKTGFMLLDSVSPRGHIQTYAPSQVMEQIKKAVGSPPWVVRIEEGGKIRHRGKIVDIDN